MTLANAALLLLGIGGIVSAVILAIFLVYAFRAEQSRQWDDE